MTAIQKDKEQEIYSNFINSINSDVTRLNYELHVDLFKKFCNQFNLSGLLAIEEPQKHIINYILSLRQRGLASSSISTMINAIYHFYDMNDVALNKKKIKMFIGQSPKKVSDRAYFREEISRILNVSDMRMKVIVLLMATAGLRIGAMQNKTIAMGTATAATNGLTAASSKLMITILPIAATIGAIIAAVAAYKIIS